MFCYKIYTSKKNPKSEEDYNYKNIIAADKEEAKKRVHDQGLEIVGEKIDLAIPEYVKDDFSGKVYKIEIIY